MPPLSLPHALLSLALGYLCGSVPFGLLLTRVAGTADLRSIGSGNIGATNVLRTGRKDLAAATLVLDALKGTFAVSIAFSLFGEGAALAAAVGAFLGHLFPVWIQFRGGKGVATFLGCLIGAAWPAALVFAIVWLAVAAITRYSSAAALGGERARAARPLFLARPSRRGAGLCGPCRGSFGSSIAPISTGSCMGPRRGSGRGAEKCRARRKTIRLTDGQRFDWLRLIRSENVGPRTFRALVDRCGGAAAAPQGAARSRAARRRSAPDPDRHGRGDRARIGRGASDRRALHRARRARLSAGSAPDRFGAAHPRLARRARTFRAGGGRDRRLAQCFGGGPDLRRSPGARPRPGRLRDRLGPRARHRPARACRFDRDRQRSPCSPAATPSPIRPRPRR